MSLPLAFFGLAVKPGTTYSQTVQTPFRISMAAITPADVDQKASLSVSANEQEFVICSLNSACNLSQQTLDLTFTTGEEISFSSVGNCTVFLTGNFVSLSDEDDLFSEGSDLNSEELSEDDEEDVELTEEEMAELRTLMSANGNLSMLEGVEELTEEDESEMDSEDEEMMGAEEEVPVEKENKKIAPVAKAKPDTKAQKIVAKKEVQAKEAKPEKPQEKKRKSDAVPAKAEAPTKKTKVEAAIPALVADKSSPIAEKATKAAKVAKAEKPTKAEKAAKAEKPAKVEKAEKAEKAPKEALKESEPHPKIKKLPSGLIIETLSEGTGARAKSGKKIGVRYIGKLQNGKVFDSNTKGSPFRFCLGRGEVIKGWDLGLQNANPGTTVKLTIPPALAYGRQGAPPDIPPNSTLIFEIKVLELR